MKTITVGHYDKILDTTIVGDDDTQAAVDYAVNRLRTRGYRPAFVFEQRLTLTKAPAEVAYVTWADTTPNDLGRCPPLKTTSK